MPIEPIKIPQNVYIEDRIVGPLTLKQVIICAIGGGFSYAMFASISKTYGEIALPIQILVWIPAAVSVLFAFVRINDLSMMRLCLLFLEKLNKPSTRTWTPRRGIIINVRTFHTVPESKHLQHKSDMVAKQTDGIDELSSVLDRPINELSSEKPLAMEKEDTPFNDEPVSPDEEALFGDNPNVIRQPVNKTRIVASPVGDTPIDGVAAKTGAVSVFRDISPA